MKSLFLALLSACCLIAHTQAQVLNSGLLSGSAFANITGVGTAAWTNVSNLASNNSTPASVSILLGVLATANTQYISASSYGMSIPSNAVIDGIEVQVRRRAQGLGVGCSLTDNIVSIVKRGSLAGVNKKSATAWPTSYTYISYGSDTALWGTSWTPEDINDGGFGVALSTKFSSGLVGITLTAQVDHIQTIVYYHVPPIALPVKLVSFNAAVKGNADVELNWATALEINNDYFEVQRSSDAINWNVLDEVRGNGNSTVMNNYSYVDDVPLGGTAYYRLKQIDYDGAFEYSPIATVSIGAVAAFNFDIVFTQDNTIVLRGNTNESAAIKLYNTNGAQVYSFNTNINSKTELRDSGLPGGMYVAVASTSGCSKAHKLYLGY